MAYEPHVDVPLLPESCSILCVAKQFDTLPLDFACMAPDHWFQIPESERQHRGEVASDSA